ncbi:MAG: SWIM zinc finger family protein [Snowella sp.]|nr:SWIM zinc finger family protein [Snowella sp.]
MSLPQFDETLLRNYANPKSFQRGEDYFYRRAVSSLVLRDNLLLAVVEGSASYDVCVEFQNDTIDSANCTCPYDYDGWCKHIVATLLTCLRQPNKIEECPSLAQLLEPLDLQQTQQLIQQLVDKQPELLNRIESVVNRIAPRTVAVKPSSSKQVPKIDTSSYRSQIRRLLRDAVRSIEDYEYGYDDEDPVPEELFDLVQDAQMFTKRGDGYNAIALLETITDTCAKNWDELDEYGADNNLLVDSLNEAWTEAILSTELTSSEKVDLEVNLEHWSNEWKADFSMSLAALHQGWENRALQQILAGEEQNAQIWEGGTAYYADNLVLIRLKILENQERYEEYLRLAKATGQGQQYLTMLAKLDRIDEVMKAASQQLQTMEQALAVSETLVTQGAMEQGLQIARKGLMLQGYCRYQLAKWISELAQELDQPDIVLAAEIRAFQSQATFTDYHRIKKLAGEDWPLIKEDLLNSLRTYDHEWDYKIHETKTNIYLEEGLIEDAIAAVDGLSSYDFETIYKVMKAAVPHNPEWVIQNGKKRAEKIMNEKKAEYYDRAVNFLSQVKQAYIQLHQSAEWSSYRAKIAKEHARKHKLMGLFGGI